MSNEHIIDILESNPLDALGESELARVREHAGGCAGCRRAYEAARVSALLLKERSAQEFAPSPFFQTRVMAALREQQQAAGEMWSLRRMWRTAGALVSSMAVAVVALAVFTFVVPGTSSTGTTTSDVASVSDPYSGEEIQLVQDEASDEMTYEQVLTSIYESGEDATR